MLACRQAGWSPAVGSRSRGRPSRWTALILEQLMRAADPVGPLEQGWVLDALQTRFTLSLADLARRFDKTASWVSRRLARVRDLPEPIHGEVRAGRLAPHAAMKYPVPLARAYPIRQPPESHEKRKQGLRRKTETLACPTTLITFKGSDDGKPSKSRGLPAALTTH